MQIATRSVTLINLNFGGFCFLFFVFKAFPNNYANVLKYVQLNLEGNENKGSQQKSRFHQITS